MIAVGVLVATLAACGGGDGEDGGPDSVVAIGRAEFVKQANAACRSQRDGLMKRVADFERRRGGKRPEPYGDVVHFVLLPTIEEEVRRAEEIDPPPEEEERVDAMFFAQRVAVDKVAVMPRVPSLKAAERHFAEAGGMLRAYGLTACAHGPR